jgi:hypothetical protein
VQQIRKLLHIMQLQELEVQMVVVALMIRTVNGQLLLQLPYWHVNRATMAAAAAEISSGQKRLSCSWMPPDA